MTTSNEPTEMQGSLFKWTNMMKGYQHRWFVMDEKNGLLSYYTSKEKLIKGERRGCIRLKGAVLGILDEDDTFFTITADGKVFHCKAQTAELRDKWVSCLEQTITRHSKRRLLNNNSQVKEFTVEDFNKKLTETDSYLQILINQFNKIDDKITNCSSDVEKSKLIHLRDQSQFLLGSIKHTIVLLQIAKNVKYPINGLISNIKDESCKVAKSNQEQNKSDCTSNTAESSLESDNLPSSSSISEHLNNIPTSRYTPETSTPKENKFSLNVPDVSYASSDEEDCFYDANEDSLDNCETNKMNLKNLMKPNINNNIVGSSELDVNYDKIYESDDDDEIETFESHGSVISHLISQVKIGMDLTKVALPTFILERRSLLEMYADFFAHADIFVSIPDFKTPQERMIQTVKWYLSAFHAGRKGSCAKKPYNPVLGEVFKCYWSLSDSTNPSSKSGPVPWAKSGDLTFIAEQVSHHPPISAFYAESIDKRIMCSAHIWTKSKFLGLSIGVNNIGIGSIYLLDHGEEYTCNFPSAYGRSILTEPWFELGGSIEINCQQTGYSSKIEFLTKPFYGGKKHRISAEVYGPPPTKKLIITINGEWNGKMEAKWANSSKSELFIDTKSIPIIKKQVLSIKEQEEYESRNLWKVVTASLKRQDVNEATAAKYKIEQHQRDLVKEREDNSLKWEHRAFHSVGDKWFFNNSLTSRK